jgi:hypothetical protein
MTQGNRDPFSSPLSFTDQQQRRPQAMDTAVPGRSASQAVRSPFALPRRTAVSKASVALSRRTAVSKASVARYDKDRDKDSVTSDCERLLQNLLLKTVGTEPDPPKPRNRFD